MRGTLEMITHTASCITHLYEDDTMTAAVFRWSPTTTYLGPIEQEIS